MSYESVEYPNKKIIRSKVSSENGILVTYYNIWSTCRFCTVSIKELVIVIAFKGWDSAHKCAYLVSLWTTTMMTLFPYDFGEPIIKYIETSIHLCLGMESGCRRLGVLIVSTLFCWKTKHSATNFWTLVLRPSQKYLSLPCGRFLRNLSALLLVKSGIQKVPFAWARNFFQDISDPCTIASHIAT